MTTVPKLTLVGKLRYLKLPLGGAAAGGLLGAAAGHDLASPKSRKKAVLTGLALGGGLGAAGGGVLSRNLYKQNVSRMRAHLELEAAQTARTRAMARKAQQVFKDRPVSGLRAEAADKAWDTVDASFRTKFRAALNDDLKVFGDEDIARFRKWGDRKLDDVKRDAAEASNAFRSGRRPYRPFKPFYDDPEPRRTFSASMRDIPRAQAVYSAHVDDLASWARREIGGLPLDARFDALPRITRTAFEALFRPNMSVRQIPSLMSSLKFRFEDIVRQAKANASRSRWEGADDWWRSAGSGGQSSGRRAGAHAESVTIDTLGAALGVDLRKAQTKSEVKKAYRAWAMKNHPDRGGSTAVFQEVNGRFDKYKKSPAFEKLAFVRAKVDEIAELSRLDGYGNRGKS